MICCKFHFLHLSTHRTSLMGVAILGVMIGHLMNHTVQPAILGFVARLVHTPGFLFLPGLGLYYSFTKDSMLSRFYFKRISRLYIPFVIISSFFFLYLLFIGKIQIVEFLGYVTTIGFWVYGNYYAMWYVAVSLMLYLLFPLLYKIIYPTCYKQCKIAIMRTLVLVLLFLVLYAMLDNYCHDYWKMIKLGVSKTVMFPLGILAGFMAKHNYIMKNGSFLAYIVGCIFLMFVSRNWCEYNFSTFRSLFGIPLVCILLESLKKMVMLKCVLEFCGKYSLELYLLHVITYFFLIEVTPLSRGVCMLLGIVFSFIVCQSVHRFVNKIQEAIVISP